MEESVNTANDGTDDSSKVVDGSGCGENSIQEERTKLAEEFNVQRAKMRDLFLQKEEEIRRMAAERDHTQSEMVGLRAQLQQLQTLSENQKSEMQSLQLLIHETVEASSSGSEEVRRLQARNLELEQQLNLLTKQQQAQQAQDASLAPAALVRTLARKLGGDTDQDEAVRKAQEDAVLLRSLVEPLEEEIKALKNKLRDTDNQLQVATKPKIVAKGDNKDPPCDMCQNYEQQLVAEQARSEEARLRARNAERALKIATEELEGARSVHEETVRSWHSDRDAAAAAVAALRAAVDECRATLDTKARAAEQAAAEALQQVTSLTVQRQELQETLDTLQKDNDMLIGRYTKKALEIQNEDIDLPDSVEELQEHCLHLREQLITVQLGSEQLACSEQELRAQLLQHGDLYHEQTARHATLHALYQQTRQQLDKLETDREQMSELANKLNLSNDRIEGLLNDKKRSQNEIVELRARITSLQQELDNSEKVQQDFVRLSQSLQVQLERIREAETEVRWQHDEDITECPTCHTQLTPKQKVHCRHCGRIFCGACVCHAVPTGPRRAPARVCAVCRTLLQRHTAPYFSTAPPHSPD